MLTRHVLSVPVQDPLHPANTEPVSASAVSVTSVPEWKSAAQASPQSIPPGLEVTLPFPAPAFTTVRGNVCRLNVAVTVLAPSIFTWQVLPVPEQAPPHRSNTDPLEGVAVRVSISPDAYSPVQLVPQLIPGGLLTTVPLPAPSRVTVSVYVSGSMGGFSHPTTLAQKHPASRSLHQF